MHNNMHMYMHMYLHNARDPRLSRYACIRVTAALPIVRGFPSRRRRRRTPADDMAKALNAAKPTAGLERSLVFVVGCEGVGHHPVHHALLNAQLNITQLRWDHTRSLLLGWSGQRNVTAVLDKVMGSFTSRYLLFARPQGRLVTQMSLPSSSYVGFGTASAAPDAWPDVPAVLHAATRAGVGVRLLVLTREPTAAAESRMRRFGGKLESVLANQHRCGRIVTGLTRRAVNAPASVVQLEFDCLKAAPGRHCNALRRLLELEADESERLCASLAAAWNASGAGSVVSGSVLPTATRARDGADQASCAATTHYHKAKAERGL